MGEYINSEEGSKDIFYESYLNGDGEVELTTIDCIHTGRAKKLGPYYLVQVTIKGNEKFINEERFFKPIKYKKSKKNK